MKPKNSDIKPPVPYIEPKVYFLLPRTIEQIKKVYPVPYEYILPNLKKYTS